MNLNSQHQQQGRMNRENQHSIQQQVNMENKYLNATSHTGGVKTDMTILSKFVREELFYVFVHDFKNENDDCLALACEEFIAYCLDAENKGLITNPHIQHASDKEFKAYLRFLWKEGLKTNWKGKGNIRRDLSNEKSAVYAAIADKFKSTYSQGCVICCLLYKSNRLLFSEMVVQCIVKEKVPIPAYETLEDRTGLTRRYFMFFDTYFKAARHNKELWDIATNDKGGKNDIPYGSCIFEAHVRTTIRENYFKWILQVLGNPRLIKNDDLAVNFKTEYDFEPESLPNRLICDTVLTRLPKNCQIIYNKTAKEFRVVLDKDNDDSDDSVSEFQSVDGNRVPGDDDDGAIPPSPLPKNIKDIQDQQAGKVQNVVDSCREVHQEMLQLLRQKVTELRALESVEPMTKDSQNACKEAWAEAKKSLRQFTDLDKKRNASDVHEGDRPKKKKRRKTNIENKSRCSDSKVAFFSSACLELQKEDDSGLRNSWESLYKHIKNNYKVEGDDNDDSDDSDDENNNVAVPLLPKHSTLLTNLQNCRVWRKARNSGITQHSIRPHAV